MLKIQKLFQIVFLSVVLEFVESSYGDRSPYFQECLIANTPRCKENGYPAVLSWQLKIFGWTCLDELKYTCMHNTTKLMIELGGKIYQFYGKWPFVRFLGIQEPASTIFSLGNLAAHVIGWRKFSLAVSKNYLFYKQAKLYFLVNVNAWVWSAVFHSRDLDITEKLDYFCASLVVMCSIFFSFSKLVGDPRDKRCFLFGALLAAIYGHHIYVMGYIKFDYGYNMKFNVFIGTLSFIMWLLWCFLERKKRASVRKCAILVTTLYLCVGLELFDFPPIWWTFDAHSLWHLATIPLCYFWYNFLIDDGKYELSMVKLL